MKKLLVIMLAFIMLTTLVSACKSGSFEIAFVNDERNIDYNGFNKAVWESIKVYADSHNITNRYYTSNGYRENSYRDVIDKAVKSGAKVVVCQGYIFEPAVFEAQNKYPDIKFIVFEGAPHSENYGSYKTELNTASVVYAEEQLGYLAGYAAVMDGYRNLGFMGGKEALPVQALCYGYLQGIEAAALKLKLSKGDIHVKYHYIDSLDDNTINKEIAAAMYQSGVEVIFAGEDALSKLVIAAASEEKGKVIGVDVDQRNESETVITSAIKGISASVQALLDSIYENNDFETLYGGRATCFDAANEGVGLPTTVVGDKNGDAFDRFKTFDKNSYEEVFARLASGEITPLRTFAVDNQVGHATAEEVIVNLKLSLVELEYIQ